MGRSHCGAPARRPPCPASDSSLDDAPRLVYADWLDENPSEDGYNELRAALVREMIRTQHSRRTSPRASDLLRRMLVFWYKRLGADTLQINSKHESGGRRGRFLRFGWRITMPWNGRKDVYGTLARRAIGVHSQRRVVPSPGFP
ncbi:MAG TPA: TIGR02996 domain-containing protein [Gemmataceae bacterium]|nr:TIGR02996 domain-containing protein [Gemmataceae bacterium]